MKTLFLAFMVAIAVVFQLCVMAGDVVFVGCSVYLGMELGWLWAILFFWLYAKSLDKVGGLFFVWKPRNVKLFFRNFVSLAQGKE
jgi:hypothetical protein